MKTYKRRMWLGQLTNSVATLHCDCCGKQADDMDPGDKGESGEEGWVPYPCWSDGNGMIPRLWLDTPNTPELLEADLCPTCTRWLIRKILAKEIQRPVSEAVKP